MKSGSSMASYVTTGAIRRVAVDPSLDPSVQESTLETLLTEVERRAQRTISSSSLNKEDEEAVNELIVLAYRDTTLRPSAPLLEKLGYQGLDTELGDVVQYQKVLITDGNGKSKSEETRTEVESAKDESGVDTGLILAATTGIAAFAFLGALWAIVQVMGLDASLSSSSMNRGVGTPLTTQELGRLMQDETLKRTTFLDDESSSASNLEDLREDDAIMKIITGQDVRIK
jgi:pyruvate/oxaloacetate carboxyltransferase